MRGERQQNDKATTFEAIHFNEKLFPSTALFLFQLLVLFICARDNLYSFMGAERVEKSEEQW